MFEVTIRDDEVQAMLSRLLQRTGDLSGPMADIARLLANTTEDAFQDEASPFGAPWVPLKSGREGRILQDTGQLAASIDASSGKDYAELTAGKVYAAIHQFGGQAGRGHKVTIPARPFMPVNAQGVSILARPGGRALPQLGREDLCRVVGFNPRPPRRAGATWMLPAIDSCRSAFQSSPAPEGGRYG